MCGVDCVHMAFWPMQTECGHKYPAKYYYHKSQRAKMNEMNCVFHFIRRRLPVRSWLYHKYVRSMPYGWYKIGTQRCARICLIESINKTVSPLTETLFFFFYIWNGKGNGCLGLNIEQIDRCYHRQMTSVSKCSNLLPSNFEWKKNELHKSSRLELNIKQLRWHTTTDDAT